VTTRKLYYTYESESVLGFVSGQFGPCRGLFLDFTPFRQGLEKKTVKRYDVPWFFCTDIGIWTKNQLPILVFEHILVAKVLLFEPVPLPEEEYDLLVTGTRPFADNSCRSWLYMGCDL
jgi:hypothetical protein